MKKWFNKLNLTYSILICALLSVIGVSLIFMRFNGHLPIGIFIGLGFIIESLILLYKKFIKVN